MSSKANSQPPQRERHLPNSSGFSFSSKRSLFQDDELLSTKVLIRGNSTISSENNTFDLGFFSPNGKDCFLGIWYSSISPPTYIWVANRERPIRNNNGTDYSSPTLEITATGRLAVKDSGNSIVWQSANVDVATELVLFESGNLALLNPKGTVLWQSFDYPTDTWLSGMNLTTSKGLTSWRSSSDPSPGFYSLQLRPDYGEFDLVFNNTEAYWSTGNWTGEAFANVPEMMVPYIYRFHFDDPFKPTASFGFTEIVGFPRKASRQRLGPAIDPVPDGLFGSAPAVHVVGADGELEQPDNTCRVLGSCGKFGLCANASERSCECVSGFEPVNLLSWESGDFSDGCRRLDDDDVVCGKRDDGFEEVGGFMRFAGEKVERFNFSLDACERACLESCACVGLYHNGKSNLCELLFGSLLNLRNLSSDGSGADLIYVRVPKGGVSNKKKRKALNSLVLAASIVGSIAVLGFLVLLVLFLVRRRRRRAVEEDGALPILTLKVFTYKELHQVTRGFSEKLGHGGFGAVFRGKLSDSTLVAVKRLERPGTGEKEFRAEVCTIGNIQHVNLVRLRGFCSEDSHRLLVYEYMPNGALSLYLRKEGPNLSWDMRFGVAIGTARGIAYLHEECRDCIIHCDIKPENILIDSDYTPKLSDFGLAKLLGRDFSRVLATMRGTWGYVAPEWISGVAITTKADVYSYGMTLIELIGGRRNVEAPPSASGGREGGAVPEKWFFPPWAARQIIEGNIAAVIDHRLGSGYNVEEAQRVALVAVWCIQDDEAVRPTMGMVVKMLEGVVEVTVPPAPKLLQALVSGESFHGVKVDSTGLSPNNQRLSNAGSESSLGNASSPVNDVNDTQPSSFVGQR
ncbi:G-type lectin S-receptor-like serine/threonine-protein kinase SD2-2 [Morus notabilis]|uniref:Receptor-like serine/threonine-protein kinase n=1 Tax=Morus notabilis TaxID=981085 RepID=W9SC56_9ROSA|nr:G-type lectin S-receptor-like serine/threonine-protein kinase SD2-2 [Morus notabilis]